MRLRTLLPCAVVVLVTGCGTADPVSAPPTATPGTAAPEPSATRTVGGREAVNPDPQFVSYRRPEGGSVGSGAALITGTLAVRDGCLVLEPGGQVVAFDADHATFDGTTLVLTPVTAGEPTVRVKVGETLRFGGGYGDFADAADSPRVAVPRACGALAPTEVAYVEDWRTVS